MAGLDQIISFDMGGTSTDVALVDGEARASNQAEIAGFPIGVPMLDIHTVGAGGGSIARFDAPRAVSFSTNAVRSSMSALAATSACTISKWPFAEAAMSDVVDRNALSEEDVKAKYIDPAIGVTHEHGRALVDEQAGQLGGFLQGTAAVIAQVDDHAVDVAGLETGEQLRHVAGRRGVVAEPGVQPADRVECGDLHRIAAERAMRETDPVDPPHGVFDEFCARFPYEETEDQLGAITSSLKDLEGGRPMVSVTVGARAPESDVADLLRETEAAHPGVAIGSYPFFRDGKVGANFVIRSTDEGALEACRSDLIARLQMAGRDVLEALQTSVTPRVIETPVFQQCGTIMRPRWAAISRRSSI